MVRLTLRHRTCYPRFMGVLELARVTGYSSAHISRVMSGLRRPSLKCAHAIAAALGISIDELVNRLSEAA